MAWTLIVAKPAQKQAARFPAKDQNRIAAAIRAMAGDPFAGDVLKLERRGQPMAPPRGQLSHLFCR
jgi:hypothetical protein